MGIRFLLSNDSFPAQFLSSTILVTITRNLLDWLFCTVLSPHPPYAAFLWTTLALAERPLKMASKVVWDGNGMVWNALAAAGPWL